ncbi:ABC transporter substrate-binding protein [Pseudomonas sp. NA-150]|uniref:ABC transporter substrate-binding protein n=1 Tax=Pseudomonas sp. NA-150 TaxID=3367525 RepID=UPI0037C743EC
MSSPLRAWLLALSCFWLAPAHASTVVFLNPGTSTETFWVSYTAFMQAAASNLGMTLQVRYGDRDPRLSLSQAREALLGPQRPDYLVFVNELYIAPEILRLSEGSGVKLFAVNNTLTEDQEKLLGDVRGRYPNFIGSLVANDEDAGYLIAEELIRLQPKPAEGQSIELLAFSGSTTTPAAHRREVGLYRALAEHPEVRLLQLVHGGWQRQRAEEQGRQLFKRYPQVNLVWTANDEMAFGAMAALRESGRVPGKDVMFGTLNGSMPALEARLNGTLTVLVSGHFTLGGWSMVLLHDYDVAKEQDRQPPGDRQLDLIQLITPNDAKRLLKAGRDASFGIDFRQLSQAGKPGPAHYRFSLKSILP